MRLSKVIVVDARHSSELKPETSKAMENARLVLIIQPDGSVRRVFHENVKAEALVSLNKLSYEFHSPQELEGMRDGQYEYAPDKDERAAESTARINAAMDAGAEGASSPVDKFKNLWKGE